VLRDEYLRLIAEAGFENVTVNGARAFAIGDVVGDDLVAEFAEKSGATREELERVAGMFQSVRVSATKPA
jgi:hypothetical protein